MEHIEGDMHCHSHWSDGFDSPRQIARLARHLDFRFMVLTDHDTTKGLHEFMYECRSYGIDAMTGIEISTMYKETYFHVLGYNFDLYTMEKFPLSPLPGYIELSELSKKILSYLSAKYENRPTGIETVRDYFSLPDKVSFMHVIDYVARHTGMPFWELKKEVFLTGKFWTPPSHMLHPLDAMHIINQAGGVASLAHPEAFLADKYERAKGRAILEELLQILKSGGLFAIETQNSQNTPEQIEYYLRLAEKYDLFVTAGSDYHGRYKEGSKLGAEGMSYKKFLEFKDAALVSRGK
jgi:predicted metal-dependent phosphoesterase TrpH